MVPGHSPGTVLETQAPSGHAIFFFPHHLIIYPSLIGSLIPRREPYSAAMLPDDTELLLAQLEEACNPSYTPRRLNAYGNGAVYGGSSNIAYNSFDNGCEYDSNFLPQITFLLDHWKV